MTAVLFIFNCINRHKQNSKGGSSGYYFLLTWCLEWGNQCAISTLGIARDQPGDEWKKFFTLGVERWWMAHAWRHSRLGWTGLWAIWCSYRCPCSLEELDWMTFKSPFQLKQFYDSMFSVPSMLWSYHDYFPICLLVGEIRGIFIFPLGYESMPSFVVLFFQPRQVKNTSTSSNDHTD